MSWPCSWAANPSVRSEARPRRLPCAGHVAASAGRPPPRGHAPTPHRDLVSDRIPKLASRVRRVRRRAVPRPYQIGFTRWRCSATFSPSAPCAGSSLPRGSSPTTHRDLVSDGAPRHRIVEQQRRNELPRRDLPPRQSRRRESRTRRAVTTECASLDCRSDARRGSPPSAESRARTYCRRSARSSDCPASRA